MRRLLLGVLLVLVALVVTPSASAGFCDIPVISTGCDATNATVQGIDGMVAWFQGLSDLARQLLSDPVTFILSVLAGFVASIEFLFAKGVAFAFAPLRGAVNNVWHGIGNAIGGVGQVVYTTAFQIGNSGAAIVTTFSSFLLAEIPMLGPLAPIVAILAAGVVVASVSIVAIVLVNVSKHAITFLLLAE